MYLLFLQVESVIDPTLGILTVPLVGHLPLGRAAAVLTAKTDLARPVAAVLMGRHASMESRRSTARHSLAGCALRCVAAAGAVAAEWMAASAAAGETKPEDLAGVEDLAAEAWTAASGEAAAGASTGALGAVAWTAASEDVGAVDSTDLRDVVDLMAGSTMDSTDLLDVVDSTDRADAVDSTDHEDVVDLTVVADAAAAKELLRSRDHSPEFQVVIVYFQILFLVSNCYDCNSSQFIDVPQP